jgi:integrase
MPSIVPHPAEGSSTELHLRVSGPLDQVAVRARAVRKKNQAETFKAGVKIYRTKWHDKKRRRIYRSHMIAYRDGHGRHLEKRASIEVARARAKQIAEDIINGYISLEQLTLAQKASLLRAEEILAPFGVSLELAVSQWVELKKTVGSASWAEVGKFWAQHHPAGAAPKTCPVIFTEMLKEREKAGAARNTLDDYESRLGRFIKDFTGPILSITAGDLNKWLGSLDVSRRTRNNYRGNLVDFYRFAKQSGYVPKTWLVLDDVPRVKNETVLIQVFTAEEIVKIIAARQEIESRARKKKHPYKTLIPYLAIGAFAGLRHEEMSAPGQPVLDWRQVDFEKEEIWVLPQVARKIGHDRIVPMHPNLVAWLKPHAKKNGPVCDLANTTNALLLASQEAGVKWKDNGLRKSFISYRLSITDNIGQVAREAGTSPDRIRHNYQKTVPKREAKRWWELWPTTADFLQVNFKFK